MLFWAKIGTQSATISSQYHHFERYNLARETFTLNASWVSEAFNFSVSPDRI